MSASMEDHGLPGSGSRRLATLAATRCLRAIDDVQPACQSPSPGLEPSYVSGPLDEAQAAPPVARQPVNDPWPHVRTDGPGLPTIVAFGA